MVDDLPTIDGVRKESSKSSFQTSRLARFLLAAAFAALAPAFAAADGPAPERSAPPSPFADAVAAWGFDGPAAAPRSPRLEPHGGARLGVPLEGTEREESIRHGGDGRVADFADGGWLDAGQGAAGELNLRSRAFTLAVRLQDPAGRWDAPLVSKHGGHDRLVYVNQASSGRSDISKAPSMDS